jgi:predicted metal-dependent hydrolase
MLTLEQITELMDIFYNEAPHDYVIVFEKKKRKKVKGSCLYSEKICYLYGSYDYYESLEVILHEVAHARIQHKTHSDVWEKELVRLLTKYKFPRQLAGKNTVIGPNVKKYKEGASDIL